MGEEAGADARTREGRKQSLGVRARIFAGDGGCDSGLRQHLLSAFLKPGMTRRKDLSKRLPLASCLSLAATPSRRSGPSCLNSSVLRTIQKCFCGSIIIAQCPKYEVYTGAVTWIWISLSMQHSGTPHRAPAVTSRDPALICDIVHAQKICRLREALAMLTLSAPGTSGDVAGYAWYSWLVSPHFFVVDGARPRK